MNTYKQEYIICPWCGDESGCRIDHLYGVPGGRSWGPWNCENCQLPFHGTVDAFDQVKVMKDHTAKKLNRSLVLLKLEGKEYPIYFVINYTYTGVLDESAPKYFFEAHGCPTNWLSECEAVIVEGEPDPHGFLEFVQAVPVPSDYDVDEEDLAKIFPEAFK